jgi:hypothetical protein
MINLEPTKTDYIICLSVLAINFMLAFWLGVYVFKSLGIAISLIK